jgi:hypothetical protein
MVFNLLAVHNLTALDEGMQLLALPLLSSHNLPREPSQSSWSLSDAV